MAFLDRVSKTASETGQKARDMAEIARLNGKIAENKRKVKQLYETIGEFYVDSHAEDAEEGLADQVSQVQELKKQSEEWNDQIQSLRGLVKCPKCGEYVAKNAPYCTSCGQRLLPEDAVICPNCGEVLLESGISFCTKCGMRLPDRKASQQDASEGTTTSQSDGSAASKAAVRRCSNCGAPLEEDAAFCAECGTPVAKATTSKSEPAKNVCPNCGTPLEEGAAFCAECGAPVAKTANSESQAAKKFCPNCGAEQNLETLFCTECGTRLD